MVSTEIIFCAYQYGHYAVYYIDFEFGELPGNVVLKKGEANMLKRCVVNVTQVKSVDKSSIRDKIGSLSKSKMEEVEAGLKLTLDLSS